MYENEITDGPQIYKVDEVVDEPVGDHLIYEVSISTGHGDNWRQLFIGFPNEDDVLLGFERMLEVLTDELLEDDPPEALALLTETYGNFSQLVKEQGLPDQPVREDTGTTLVYTYAGVTVGHIRSRVLGSAAVVHDILKDWCEHQIYEVSIVKGHSSFTWRQLFIGFPNEDEVLSAIEMSLKVSEDALEDDPGKLAVLTNTHGDYSQLVSEQRLPELPRHRLDDTTRICKYAGVTVGYIRSKVLGFAYVTGVDK